MPEEIIKTRLAGFILWRLHEVDFVHVFFCSVSALSVLFALFKSFDFLLYFIYVYFNLVEDGKLR